MDGVRKATGGSCECLILGEYQSPNKDGIV